MEKNEQTHFIVNYLTETWSDLVEYILRHPEKIAMGQINYWQTYMNLCQEFSGEQKTSDSSSVNCDKRFQHTEWQNNLIFNFIQRSYQLISQQTDVLAQEFADQDQKVAQKFRFYANQFIDSMAPSNFISTNPEILSAIVATNGANLAKGFKQFQEDLQQGRGQLAIPIADFSQFELGKNLACSKGKVIYQNELMQLIQYSASTEKVYQNPLLMIPPWINKYYILDLQQENSMVKWLVDQGYTVFMISWINPSSVHQDKEFSHYLLQGPLAALDVIAKIQGTKKINVLGYCIGGTLLGCLLAYLAEKPQPYKIMSATFLTTLFDFSEPGELGTFIDEKQITLLENQMNKKGYLDGNVMALVFNALRANDLIWSAFVNQYLKGQKLKPLDFLYWNADATNIPAKTHSYYLRKMYLHNQLIQPGQLTLNGVALNLSKITTPSYFIAAHDDHIVPWTSCYRGLSYLQHATRFVLAVSGHVAGVINPPHKNKYGYWTNTHYPKDSAAFLASASFHEGSWWNDWQMWLKQFSGKLESVPASTQIKNGIEDAPGSYVKVRLADIAKTEQEQLVTT